MAPDASALRHEALTHVETTLYFFVPDGEKPKVLMADDYTQENRRTGTFRDELVTIHNGRLTDPAPALEREGFELVEHISNVSNFYDEDQIMADHYPEIIRFLKEAARATDVYIFDTRCECKI